MHVFSHEHYSNSETCQVIMKHISIPFARQQVYDPQASDDPNTRLEQPEAP